MFYFQFLPFQGLILYNGQETDNGDFLCFGLRERYPEFRFNVGSGPAIIQGNQTLELDKWYTIQLKRDRREGEVFKNSSYFIDYVRCHKTETRNCFLLCIISQ